MRTTRLSSVYPSITKRWSPSATHTNDETLLVIHPPHSRNTTPVRWIGSGSPLNWGSHRTSNTNLTVSGSDVVR